MVLQLKYNGTIVIELSDTNTMHTLMDKLHSIHTSKSSARVRSTGVKRYDDKMYIVTSMKADADIATLENNITEFAEEIVSSGFEENLTDAEDKVSVHS